MTKRALVVYNPVARGVPRIERLHAGSDALTGWDVSLQATASAGHATELAREAAQAGLDAVVACGGDGTVNEVANGLAGSQTTLAVVRGGTANVWAKEARLPKRPDAAVRLLAEGEVRAVDLGRALWPAPQGDGERYFLLMAGVGLDAAIVREVSDTLKRRLGAGAYVLHGVQRSLTYRSVPTELSADGADLSVGLYWLLVGNTRSYGGLLDLTHLALADDGLLDACLLRKGGILRLAWLLPWVLLRRHHRRPEIRYQHVRSFDVRTAGLPVQIDGEYLGETPMRFDVAPAALRVLVPPGTRGGMWG
jgi:YegS/Rv2252/BmrU family lipid kinase